MKLSGVVFFWYNFITSRERGGEREGERERERERERGKERERLQVLINNDAVPKANLHTKISCF